MPARPTLPEVVARALPSMQSSQWSMLAPFDAKP